MEISLQQENSQLLPEVLEVFRLMYLDDLTKLFEHYIEDTEALNAGQAIPFMT